MVDADDARLKAEIDQIVAHINGTMKKIEQVVPLNPAPSEKNEADENNQTPSQSQTPEKEL